MNACLIIIIIINFIKFLTINIFPILITKKLLFSLVEFRSSLEFMKIKKSNQLSF